MSRDLPDLAGDRLTRLRAWLAELALGLPRSSRRAAPISPCATASAPAPSALATAPPNATGSGATPSSSNATHLSRSVAREGLNSERGICQICWFAGSQYQRSTAAVHGYGSSDTSTTCG
jgi:hypothetical protein